VITTQGLMAGEVTENNMADTNASLLGTLSPEDYAQQQAINRQQQMASMLMQQNQQPQGQMISGRYVKPSIFQQLQPVANMLAGAYIAKSGDTEAAKLAQKLRTQEMADLVNYQKTYHGTPAVEGGIVGPNGMTTQTTADMYGPNMELNAPYKQVAPVAAQPANPQLANLNAALSYSAPLRAMGMKKLTEGPNWAEVSQLNSKTGDTDTYLYDRNSSDPKSTMRFVATSKPALSLDQRLTLQDRGIAIPNGNGMPTGNAAGGNPVMPNPAMVNPAVVNPSTVNTMQKPVAGNPVIKPVSTTGLKENELVSAFGYDPFKPPPPPAGLPSAEAARAYRADQYKPLEGESRKTVNGAASYQDALDKYVQVLNGVDMTDLANPQVRSRIDAAYNTAILTGKEAFKLGVLNGGDERILNSLLPNYKDTSQMLVFKDTIKDLAQTQKEFGTGIILKEYGSANKPVPEMYRKHIFIPKVETPANAPPANFKTENDAAKAGLKNGTKVIINGVSGTWKN